MYTRGMNTTSISDLRKNLAQTLKSVSHGNEVIITNNNKPIARIVPIASPETDDDQIQREYMAEAKKAIQQYHRLFEDLAHEV